MRWAIFRDQDSSQAIESSIHQGCNIDESKLTNSKFLDFSCIKERKTRKEIINDISFESKVHNIYNPEFDSDSEDLLNNSVVEEICKRKSKVAGITKLSDENTLFNKLGLEVPVPFLK